MANQFFYEFKVIRRIQ